MSLPPVALPPTHPGEILREEYLAPLGMSAGKLAKALNVPRTRIERIVAEEVPVSIDTALRLSRLFGTTPRFWLNLQAAYDLAVREPAMAKDLAKIRRLEVA